MPDIWKRRGVCLRRLREKRGWTQSMLAQKAGVARVTVARLEIGYRRPSVDMLDKLAKALKVKVGDLLS